MQLIAKPAQLRKQILQWRREGQRIAFVPTLGDLHEGHLALVRKAAEHADVVVVSIFANPFQLQKKNIDEADNSTRVFEQDITLLQDNGVAVVFNPSADDMTQTNIEYDVHVEAPKLTTMLIDADISHPKHMQLLTTTLCKLFNLVQPDLAVFGEKDYQRLVIIQKMVEDLCYPIEIVSIPTVREMDGLVISRRNKLLTVDERQRAPVLSKTLRWTSSQIRGGRRDFDELIQDGKDQLRAAGIEPEEMYIRDAKTMQMVTDKTNQIVILAAASISNLRLVDNQIVDITSSTSSTNEEEE